MVKWKRDLILGAFLLVFSIILFFYTGATIGTNTITIKLAQPQVYVQMWLVVLGILAAILIVKSLVKKEDVVLPAIWGRLQIFTVVAMVIYLLVMKWIGFFLSSIIFLSIVIIVYSYKANKIKSDKKQKALQIGWYIVFSVISVAITQYLFAEVLGVLLPRFSL